MLPTPYQRAVAIADRFFRRGVSLGYNDLVQLIERSIDDALTDARHARPKPADSTQALFPDWPLAPRRTA